jgi:GAF domain-containing protein
VNDPDRLRLAASAGIGASEEGHAALLRSIVEVARAIFSARASSIQLFDEQTDELMFEAVAGEGADTLVGKRFPASAGVAGWVLAARQPLVIEDVAADPRFARDVAEGTGYVPEGLMAVPLLLGEQALGVLEVLDRPERSKFSLAEMDLLGLFAEQASLALDLSLRARRAKRLVAEGGDDISAVASLASALDSLEEEKREAGIRLLNTLEELLRA